MTNEEAKQQAIKNAYGEYFNLFRKYIDANGWIAQSDFFLAYLGLPDSFEVQVKGFPPKGATKWRPKQLKGIESNNGWIRIENENDLPKEKCRYWIANKNGIFDFIADIEMIESKYKNKTLTHYKKIEEPKHPIF